VLSMALTALSGKHGKSQMESTRSQKPLGYGAPTCVLTTGY
jgi:hypothetical protein